MEQEKLKKERRLWIWCERDLWPACALVSACAEKTRGKDYNFVKGHISHPLLCEPSERDALRFTTTESLWKYIQRFSHTQPSFTQQHQRFSAAGPPGKAAAVALPAGELSWTSPSPKKPSNISFRWGDSTLARKRQISSVKPRPADIFSGWMSERWRVVAIGYLPTGSWRRHLLTVASRRRAAWQVRIVMQKSHVECVSDLFYANTTSETSHSVPTSYADGNN